MEFKYLEGRSMIGISRAGFTGGVYGSSMIRRHLFGCVVEAQYDTHSLIHRVGSRDTCGTTTGVVATDTTEATSSSAVIAAIGEIVT